MSEKISGYTLEQLQAEIDRRARQKDNYEKVCRLLMSYGVEQSEEGELFFQTGQFDRCDPPSPYVEDVSIKSSGYRGEVSVTMSADAWEQFLWMVQCKDVEDDG